MRGRASTQDLIELAQPALRRLAAESGETVNLFVPGPRGTEAIAQIDGSHLLGATNWLERELPLLRDGGGQGAARFRDGQLGERPLERLTPATIADHPALEAELDKVRTVGYATLVDELEEGLSAVAAPVREHDGAVVGALTVSGATLRLPHTASRSSGASRSSRPTRSRRASDTSPPSRTSSAEAARTADRH